jgi:predicted transposase/invertase (TIGR01784 family)
MKKQKAFSALEQYQKSLLTYLELKGVVDTARDEGEAKGIEKGIRLIAMNLKNEGLSLEVISRVTGLSNIELEKL